MFLRLLVLEYMVWKAADPDIWQWYYGIRRHPKGVLPPLMLTQRGRIHQFHICVDRLFNLEMLRNILNSVQSFLSL